MFPKNTLLADIEKQQFGCMNCIRLLVKDIMTHQRNTFVSPIVEFLCNDCAVKMHRNKQWKVMAVYEAKAYVGREIQSM